MLVGAVLRTDRAELSEHRARAVRDNGPYLAIGISP
jgi:hypothetical protein